MNNKTFFCFYRSDNKLAVGWEKKIKNRIRLRHKGFKESSIRPDFLIVLGGDGTVLEAVRKYRDYEPVILAFNLGNLGFLAAVRDTKLFLKAIDDLFSDKYIKENRMLLSVEVRRKKEKIFSAEALNEVVVQNLISMVNIEANVEGHPIQYIRGTGVLVSTATGSTAYNLSAHGPVVMPELECMILTELLDHNIPTPSLVVPKSRKITLRIESFRKNGLLAVAKTGNPVDVILSADSESIFPLEAGDLVQISEAPRKAVFAIFDKNHFLKSIQEKFSFK